MTTTGVEDPADFRELRTIGPASHAVKRSFYYREPATPDRIHPGLPSPWLTIVLSLAGTIPIGVLVGDRVRMRSFAAPVGGLHTAPVQLPQQEPGVGIQLAVHPFASRALFGMPAGELAGQVVELGDLLKADGDPALADLTEGRLAASAAAVAVRSWISRRLDGASLPRPELRQAWRLIATSGGQMQIGAVAAEVGWSRRYLSDQMRAETGLTAKDLARVTRFDRTVDELRSPRRPALAAIAVDCGYSDQAHLAAEWRQFAGCSATAWLSQRD
ncbi:AraC-like DNA-binding protein [Nakamurella sp. UYEF19]|uniref:helix-turn-helix domain-containing protein n=1 Tax=Nakamurella sp. UYEF19 TaxID=1756392 RepID=UPI003392B296